MLSTLVRQYAERKKYSAAKIKIWYNEKAGSEETETAANHDRLKKGQAKQTDDETKIY